MKEFDPIILVGMRTKRDPKETRQSILDAAFQEVHRKGFQAAGLNDILSRTGVTKGAFYHHFPTKADLGYALIDETLAVYLQDWWLEPLEGTKDPVATLSTLIDSRLRNDIPGLLPMGCPINNLAQEMAPLDEGFRQRLDGLYRLWRKGIALALRRGQHARTVKTQVETDEAACLIVSAIQGAFAQSKAADGTEPFEASTPALKAYLASLAP